MDAKVRRAMMIIPEVSKEEEGGLVMFRGNRSNLS
jgi:hypothetical protein